MNIRLGLFTTPINFNRLVVYKDPTTGYTYTLSEMEAKARAAEDAARAKEAAYKAAQDDVAKAHYAQDVQAGYNSGAADAAFAEWQTATSHKTVQAQSGSGSLLLPIGAAIAAYFALKG